MEAENDSWEGVDAVLDRTLLSGNLFPEKNRFRNKRLGAAAGALGGVAVSQSAQAGIHHDLGANAGPGDSIPLLLPFQADYANAQINLFLDTASGGMSMGEMSFGFGGASSLQWVGQPGLDSMGMAAMGMDAWHSLLDLNLGDTVDGSLSADYNGQPFGYLMRENVHGQGWGNGSPPTTGYAGFQFTIDGTPVFGWMKVRVESTSFTLEEWAYDNTGAGIEVGVIPEPSTALLLGLGLAGLAAAGVKKRRRIAECTDGDQP